MSVQREATIVDFPHGVAEAATSPALQRLQQALAAAQRRAALLETLIDRLSLGVALVDAEGRLHYANRAANTIMTRRDSLCERNGMLIGRSVGLSRLLAQGLAQVIGGYGDSEALSLPRHGGGEPYTVLLARQDAADLLTTIDRPGEQRETIGGPWSFLSDAEGSAARVGRPMALMLIRDPQHSGAGNFAALRQYFGLTASEAALLEALTFGERLNDFCRRRGISPNTGKFHLRGLFAKTGTNRQADLIRRTISLLASFTPFG